MMKWLSEHALKCSQGNGLVTVGSVAILFLFIFLPLVKDGGVGAGEVLDDLRLQNSHVQKASAS